MHLLNMFRVSFVRSFCVSFVTFVHRSFVFRFVRSPNKTDERNERYTKRTIHGKSKPITRTKRRQTENVRSYFVSCVPLIKLTKATNDTRNERYTKKTNQLHERNAGKRKR